MWILLSLILITALLAARAFLVTMGTIKDPILQSFEVFGEEQHYSPSLWLVVWTGATLYLSLFLYFPAGQVVMLGVLVGLAISGLAEPVHRLRERYNLHFKNFPKWYHIMVERTDREERRRIAYHWLRLPARTRWLYNARTELFWQWVDQVLITVG